MEKSHLFIQATIARKKAGNTIGSTALAVSHSNIFFVKMPILNVFRKISDKFYKMQIGNGCNFLIEKQGARDKDFQHLQNGG